MLFCAAIVIVVREAYGFAGVRRRRLTTSRRRTRSCSSRCSSRRCSSWSASARSTTGSTGRPGKPTRPEDHSGHGAHSVARLLPGQHRSQGDRHPVRRHVVLLHAGRRPAGDAGARRARRAGPQFVDANAYNGLFSVHASLMIFLFIIPVFAGLANFVLPLMIGAPDMAFPRLNALSFWMLPIAGTDDDGVVLRPGRLVRDRLDGLRAALDRRRRSARCSSRSACSSRARRRSPPR